MPNGRFCKEEGQSEDSIADPLPNVFFYCSGTSAVYAVCMEGFSQNGLSAVGVIVRNRQGFLHAGAYILLKVCNTAHSKIEKLVVGCYGTVSKNNIVCIITAVEILRR